MAEVWSPPQSKPARMKLWTNGMETIVAADHAGIQAALEEVHDCDPYEGDDGNKWEEVDPDKRIEIRLDGSVADLLPDHEARDLPTRGVVLVSATAAEWAKTVTTPTIIGSKEW